MSTKKISPEKIMEELAAIGFAQVTDYLYIRDDELILKPTEKLSKAKRAAIASAERTSSGVRIKFYDKMKALELLGRHLGMFEGKSEGPGEEENNLLEAIIASTQEEIDTDDIPEIQQTPDSGHELVEPSQSQRG